MPMYIHWAEVIVPAGERFPLDMLRHDCCYPSGQDSIGAMMPSRFPGADARRRVIVAHRSQVATPPWSVARWASFGCTITHKRSQRV